MINPIKIYTEHRSLFTKIMTCAALSIGLGSCERGKIVKSNLNISTEETKIDKADSVTFIISQNGHTRARIRTKEFIQNENAKPPFLDMNKGLIVQFYDDSLQVESTLTANTARFYTLNNNILVQKNVEVINNKGEKLITEQMVWNNSLEQFYSQKPVKIIRGNSITYGTGLEANRDFSWIRIYNQTGTIPVEKGQLPND